MNLSKINAFLNRVSDLKKIPKALPFFQEYSEFKKASKDSPRFTIKSKDIYPCLTDKTSTTGFDRHYIFHPAWAARILAITQPKLHIDISSSLTFCSIVSAFLPVKFYDYRPAELNLTNLESKAGNLHHLPFPDETVESLSCMHVIEHIGLGRYGDPLDPEGDLKSIKELVRVLAKDGTLLFVTPVGKPKLMFNAHRIYSFDQIKDYFGGLELMEFALVPDNPQEGGLIRNATKEMADAQTYGCGCFWFKKV